MAKKRPMPGEAPNYQERNKARFSWDTEGLMEGGGPRSDKSIRGASDLNRMAGNEGSAYGRAIQARQKNIEGHNEASRKAMKDIKLAKMKADAEKPGASLAAKLRYKYEKNTFREAKGGSVKKMAKGGSTASKRGDGCATKGKTKGRFV